MFNDVNDSSLFLGPEDLLEEANQQAHALIQKASEHASMLIEKANSQAGMLLERADQEAEALLIQAHENDQRLNDKAALGEKILLSYANSHEQALIQQANLVIKELVARANIRQSHLCDNAVEQAIGLVVETSMRAEGIDRTTKESTNELLNKSANHATDLVLEAGEQARSLVAEADKKAKGLVLEAEVHASGLVIDAGGQAKTLINEASIQAKNLVKLAAVQAKGLVGQAASETKVLINDAAMHSKGLIREAATEYIKNKSSFLNVAAHELRTPITSISLGVQLAEREIERARPVTEQHLKQIRAPLNRLSRLLNYLIDMSKFERKRLVIETVPTDLVALISDCLEVFRLENPNYVFNFEKHSQKVELDLDPLRIHQVIANILDNAIKYSGSEVITVNLSTKPGCARVEISDQGIGIKRENLDQLFTSFHRGGSDVTAKVSGLGLGLLICKEIIRLHKGMIGYDSETISGSRFYFELPLKDC